MRKAIVTKYIGPTNTKGSRYKATAEGGNSITIGADDALSFDKNHLAAAQALANKIGWVGRWEGGGMPDGGFVFVNVSNDGFTVE